MSRGNLLAQAVSAGLTLVAWMLMPGCAVVEFAENPASIIDPKSEMFLASNVPGTVFRVRERKVDARPEEGWSVVGTGNEIVVSLSTSGRYEIAAHPPGYMEKRVALTEPIKRYEFHFVQADRFPRSVGPSQPAPRDPPRRPPKPMEVTGELLEGLGTYHALVIGNNDYRGFPRLRTAVADAEAVSALLHEEYGFEVTVLKNATRSDLISTLGKLGRNLGSKDNLLLYYAGHGWYDKRADRGYWLPVDATRSDKTHWVSNTDITDALKAMDAKHVMVVADSCYSGTLTRGVRITEHRSGYLARMAAKRTRVVLSSGGLEPVEDSGGGRHSVFAKAFLETLNENQGVLDGTALFTAVRPSVMRNSPQTPEYRTIRFAGDEGGDFLFWRLPRGANR